MDVMETLLPSSHTHGCRTKAEERSFEHGVKETGRLELCGPVQNAAEPRCPSIETSVPYLPQHCPERTRSRRKTTLTKRRAGEPRGRGFGHRRLHFHRHLVIADLQRYRAHGRAVFRT